MKNLFIALFIIGSLLSLTFGLAIMPNMSGQSHGQCPFETAGITNCAQAQNLVGVMAAHVGAFSQLFAATLAGALTSFFALFSVLVFALVIFYNKDSALSPPVLIYSRPRKPSVSLHGISFVQWLALHENSPAFVIRRPH